MCGPHLGSLPPNGGEEKQWRGLVGGNSRRSGEQRPVPSCWRCALGSSAKAAVEKWREFLTLPLWAALVVTRVPDDYPVTPGLAKIVERPRSEMLPWVVLPFGPRGHCCGARLLFGVRSLPLGRTLFQGSLQPLQRRPRLALPQNHSSVPRVTHSPGHGTTPFPTRVRSLLLFAFPRCRLPAPEAAWVSEEGTSLTGAERGVFPGTLQQRAPVSEFF